MNTPNPYQILKNGWDCHITRNGAPFLISVGNLKLDRSQAQTICAALNKREKNRKRGYKRASRTRILKRAANITRREGQSVNQ